MTWSPLDTYCKKLFHSVTGNITVHRDFIPYKVSDEPVQCASKGECLLPLSVSHKNVLKDQIGVQIFNSVCAYISIPEKHTCLLRQSINMKHRVVGSGVHVLCTFIHYFSEQYG